MIFLYILLGFLVLIAALLIIPIGVSITAGDDFTVWLHFIGLRFKLFPNHRKKHTKIKRKKQKDETGKKTNEGYIKQLFTKHGVSGGVGKIVSILKTLCEKSLYITRHITVKSLEFYLTVATDDAAKTAIEYGAVNAIVYPFLAFLDNNLIIKRKTVNINCDFNSTKSNLSANVFMSVKPLYILIATFGALMKLVAVKGDKNEREQ